MLKEFYQLANKVLRIKRSHPVVSRVQRVSENGDLEILDDKNQAEQAIAGYFTQIYKRPDHMKLPVNIVDEEMKEEHDDLDSYPLFTREEINDAAKVSNFNKGLGPDCFDGNVLKNNEKLREKVVYEITDAMNS